ncbi:uncharacterized protein LOC113230833 [Hyposmocoma kahamanoa]|uniref:uncharacterized protein LOC113230833 n=1 Tax=Hyposmocoma kahamanoa TaxID=1477025 RepID=UPI000E6D8885|nr:uncharacterized protein LOC113230833 [Hyposmocoma kahamanoa]
MTPIDIFFRSLSDTALDGLSWVASERTVLERLFDVELLAREAGNTSALLYDPDMNAPTCFSVTWWGEEWSLGTFDAMLFGCIFIATTNSLLSALITIIVWQILKCARSWSGDRNQREKTNIEIIH